MSEMVIVDLQSGMPLWWLNWDDICIEIDVDGSVMVETEDDSYLTFEGLDG